MYWIQVAQAGSLQSSIENSFDALGNVSNTVSGITCSYSYNIMGQVTNITYRTSGGSLSRSLDYAYNEVGMITNKTTVGGGQTTEVGYTYGCLDRLLSESRSTSLTNSTVSTTSFSYDLAGNRLNRTVDGLGVSYTLGTGNRLASAGTIGVIDVEGRSTEPIGTDDSWGELWVSKPRNFPLTVCWKGKRRRMPYSEMETTALKFSLISEHTKRCSANPVRNRAAG